jgi:hypothetical protein
MTSVCPNGHTSASDDYCDVCGAPIDATAAGQSAAPAAPPTTAPVPASEAPAPVSGVQLCPNCSTENVADALFCEACGYDFTTGTMPRSAVQLSPPDAALEAQPPTPTPNVSSPEAAKPDQPAANVSPELSFSWVAEVWIDPAWYEAQESPDALPSAGLPAIVPLRHTSILIGRKSKSRNINPDIDCEPDTGTSRRQAQLTTDGTRWWVEDLGSSNGTFVGAASEPLPEDPIPVGPRRELRPDDRIYVGAWTRLVIREATEDEVTSLP